MSDISVEKYKKLNKKYKETKCALKIACQRIEFLLLQFGEVADWDIEKAIMKEARRSLK